MSQRFFWRERTEKINWRLLKSLDLPQLVQRGDPSLLEPFALHLTFARLPPIKRNDALEGEDYDAWYLVRVFQLSMEFLLYLRTKDAESLKGLRHEIQHREKECEVFLRRSKKWKDRTKTLENHVEKLRQILQTIGKLLQLHGATPTTISTIEALLKEKSQVLLPHNDNKSTKLAIEDIENQNFSAANEARLCGFCGKMFAASAFLESHISRRHLGDTKRIERLAQQSLPAVSDNLADQKKSNKADDVLVMNQMLEKVEEALLAHKESLKSLAKAETEKIKDLYGQLSMENELMDDIRNSRLQAQRQLDEATQRLDRVLQEKDEAAQELEEIKEQIQLLNIRRKMEANKSTSNSHEVDVTAEIEIKRLENTLSMSNKALSISQQETRVAEAKQAKTIQEKNMLEDEITQLKSQLKRYEAIMQERIPPEMKDLSAQTVLSMYNLHDAEAQTDDRVEEPLQVKSLVKIGVQTDTLITPSVRQDAAERSSIVQVAADVISTAAQPAISEVVLSQTPVVEKQDPVLQEVYMSQLLDHIQMKADNAASDARAAFGGESEARKKSFVSLPKRAYLGSRYQHEEEVVATQIEHMMDRLNNACKRYGVLPSSTGLPENHMQIIEQALHAHLEILPTEVLNKMIDQEKLVNEIITMEWLPMEEARQRALEELKIAAQEKSEKNQQLILQAMNTMNSPESIKKRASSTIQKSPTKSKQSEQEVPSTLAGSESRMHSKPASFASLMVSVANSLMGVSPSQDAVPPKNHQSATKRDSEIVKEEQHVSKPSSILVKKVAVSKKEPLSSPAEISSVSSVVNTGLDTNSSSSVNVASHEIPSCTVESNVSSLPRTIDVHSARNDLDETTFEEEIVLPSETSTESLEQKPLEVLHEDSEKAQGTVFVEIEEKSSTHMDVRIEGIEENSAAERKSGEEHDSRPSTAFSDLSSVGKFSSIGSDNDLKEMSLDTSSSGDNLTQQQGKISLEQATSSDEDEHIDNIPTLSESPAKAQQLEHFERTEEKNEGNDEEEEESPAPAVQLFSSRSGGDLFEGNEDIEEVELI